MTEPVAYMWKTAGGNVLGFQEYKQNKPYPGYVTPLYTAEQLHPRVKMTQAEFDEFSKLSLNNAATIYDVFELVSGDKLSIDEFEHLHNRLFEKTVSEQKINQDEIARLWFCYNPKRPEETIEIVPDMKWFVRSKEVQGKGNYYYLINPGQLFPLFSTNLESAGSFSTKEQAELWTNPLTEAVQLPVEDEND